MSKKILFIVSEDWYFLSHRLSLALHAKQKGFDVELICNCNKLKEKIENHGIKVVDWHLDRKSFSFISAFRSLKQLLFIVKNNKPDLIYAVAIKPVIYASIVSRILRIKNTIYAMGGLGYSFSSKKISAQILKYIFINVMKINLKDKNSFLILQNNDDKLIFDQSGLSKKTNIRIIKGSGVDLEKFKYKPLDDKSERRVILPSRMLWDKGVKDFIDCAKIIKKNLNVKFILIGSPDEHNPESIPLTILKNWKSEGIVEWWGHNSDMVKIYEKCTIVCFPSFREGLPKVLLEAGSVGRPVVSYDVTGCREVIKHNQNGLLVPFRQVKLLSDAILKLLQDTNLCTKMGLNGRQIVEKKFSEEIILTQIENVWNEALKIKH